MSAQPRDTLRRYFAGMTEQTFQTQLGVADPALVDYISDLLARFVRSETLYRIRSLAGRQLRELAEMMVEAEERVGDARREVHRHIGDFALFWTGVYPEALERMRGPLKKDHLVDYCHQGKRSYLIAGTIEASENQGASSAVLIRLSHQFEMCAYGLREVRRQWEDREGENGGPRPILLN